MLQGLQQWVYATWPLACRRRLLVCLFLPRLPAPRPLPLGHPLPLPMQIKEANPKLGKQAKVMPTSMDRVYEFARTPRR